MPGFGEQMRQISLRFVPTAILSRQVAVIRDDRACGVDRQPAGPAQIHTRNPGGLKGDDGATLVPGVFAAIPYCIDLIGGPYAETRPGDRRLPPEIGARAQA